MADLMHMRLMAVEEALRGILSVENRGKDRKIAESVAAKVLDENMAYADAVTAVAEPKIEEEEAEAAEVPEEPAEEAPAEPVEEPAEVEKKPRAKARA